MSSLCHFFAQQVGKIMRVWVESLSVPLISGISEHKTLITGSKVIHIFLNMDSLSDLLALSFNINEDAHGFIVESLVLIIIANLLADFSGDLLIVNSGSVNKSFTE